MNTYKIRGISDEQTECDCCGRKGLKRTVALEVFQNGESTLEITRVGVDCASVLMSRTGRSKSARAIKQEAQSIVDRQEAQRLQDEKAVAWKLSHRVAGDIEKANESYLAQFRSVDYGSQDFGTLLTNGSQFAWVPSKPHSSRVEERFVAHLRQSGFVEYTKG